jgi:hypothetical protein
MTIEIRLIQQVPIQAVGQVYQAASVPPVSTTLRATDTGGLLQSPLPAHGGVD